MRISDWSSDVCSSDLRSLLGSLTGGAIGGSGDAVLDVADSAIGKSEEEILAEELALGPELAGRVLGAAPLWPDAQAQRRVNLIGRWRSEEHTSELQSLMRISYAVFCLKKKKIIKTT